MPPVRHRPFAIRYFTSPIEYAAFESRAQRLVRAGCSERYTSSRKIPLTPPPSNRARPAQSSEDSGILDICMIRARARIAEIFIQGTLRRESIRISLVAARHQARVQFQSGSGGDSSLRARTRARRVARLSRHRHVGDGAEPPLPRIRGHQRPHRSNRCGAFSAFRTTTPSCSCKAAAACSLPWCR